MSKAIREPVVAPFSQPEVTQDFYKTSGVRGDISFAGDPGMTRQEFSDECDINTIMERYEKAGVVSHVNHATPAYLDTTLYKGLQASMDAFKEAQSAFLALPANVRKEFDNDPQRFVDFAVDGSNIERMREWGLAPKAADKPPPVEVVVTAGAVPTSGTPGAS
ncbi:MAG: internal scaffolding protein [Microvirus sp.]|nr:MAG: internal scaffolding protein [Microvirus sp.]